MRIGEAPHDSHRRCTRCFGEIAKDAESDFCWTCTTYGGELAGYFAEKEATRRQHVAARELGRQMGHVIKVAYGEGWRCTCGLTGYDEPRTDRSVQREAGMRHLRDVAVHG